MSVGGNAGFRRTVATGVIAALCPLACLDAFAASASAAKGGNSAAAALCEEGGYPGVLLAQDGSAFKNSGKCTSYAAHGGKIAGVNAVAGPVESSFFEANYSGFGLNPETEAFACDTYSRPGVTLCESAEVAANGTFSVEEELFPCTLSGSKVSNLFVQATTAAGVSFTRTFPPPAGC
jgi:hypothetical protein